MRERGPVVAAGLRAPGGRQDEVVFEGRSFAINADATLAGRAPSFKENLFCSPAWNLRRALSKS